MKRASYTGDGLQMSANNDAPRENPAPLVEVDKPKPDRGPYYAAMIERAEREAAGRPDLIDEADPEVLRSFREVVKARKEAGER